MPVAQKNSPICPGSISLERDEVRWKPSGRRSLPEVSPEDQIGNAADKNGVFIGFPEDWRFRRYFARTINIGYFFNYCV